MICVNSVRVCPKSISLKIGTWSYAAYAEVCPCDADCREVTWHSDDPSIASVNASSGYIYANGVGSAHIYATATDGSGCTDYLTVTVSNTVPITSVTLNRSSLSLEEGQTASLSATVCPDNATNKNVNWTSSNNAVATVSGGVVTAVSKGSARITATAADGSGKSAFCTVVVTGDILVTSIELTPSNKTLKVGYSFFPSVTVCPPNATKKSVTWSSANSNIASVNPNSGLVYAKAVGTTTIYATACDGSGVCGCCTVSVVPVYVQDVVVCPETLTLDIGERYCLEATVYPVNATNPNVSWTSGDCNIAEVDSNGCVTAKSTGTTYICANAIDGSGVHGCCEVTVNPPVVEDTVPGLKTIKQCRIRKDMSMDDSAILKDSSGTNVKLNVGDTVPLLSTSTISENGRVWYRILYNGMMLHVTADDNSFEEISVTPIAVPNETAVTVKTDGPPLNVRCTPSTDVTKLGQLSDGTTVTLTNETPQIDSDNRSWYAVYGQMSNGSYSYGWCWGDYLGNYIEYGTLVDVDTLHVRSGAGTNYTSLGTISKGDTVEILEKNCATGSGYTWHKILYNGSEGYVVAGNNTPNFTFETRWVALDTWSSSTPTYSFSSNGVTMLKSLEGFRSTAYIASSSESLYTIGYGHVITDGTKSVTINNNTYSILTEELATTLLLQDLNNIFIPKFNSFLEDNEIALNQNQYDACIMDCFQKGQNIWSKQSRLIAKFIIAKQNFDNYDKVLTAFLDGTTNAGLTNRRTKEANLFVYGTYS